VIGALLRPRGRVGRPLDMASRALRRRIAPLAAVLALAACSGRSEDIVVQSCPTVAVLAEAASVTKYRTPRGRDLTDVVVDARLTGARGECTFNRRDVTMTLAVSFDFVIGPANRDRAVNLAYFVAIVDPSGNVAAREEIPIELQVPVNQSRVGSNEEVEPRIPFRDRSSLVGYRIYVGLVLTPDEAAAQRRRR
jgi:hypothetical protein